GTACVCDTSTTLAGTPIPTCAITPPASLCPGSTETITATAAGGTGPLFITIKKNGTIISGPTQGNSLSVTATAPASGVTDTYSAHVTNSSSGSTAATTCICDNSTTLKISRMPTSNITPPASLCPGSTETITVTGSGGTGPLFITIKKNGTIISGPTQGNSLSVTATAPASGVTDTYSGLVTDSSTGSSASTTCICANSTTL